MSVSSAETSAWTLSAEGIPDGVRIALAVPGQGIDAAIVVDRDEARAFARGLMAAAGDATERTFSPDKAEGFHG